MRVVDRVQVIECLCPQHLLMAIPIVFAAVILCGVVQLVRSAKKINNMSTNQKTFLQEIPGWYLILLHVDLHTFLEQLTWI